MIYGDHYGLSDKDNKSLATLMNRSSDDWTALDNMNLQRVPFMLHMDGLKGGIQTQYGGEIDVLPTLLHLLGINTNKYVLFGQDLMSSKLQQLVAFRNNNFVTNKYTVLGGNGANGSVYDNETGELLTELSPALTKQINQWQAEVDHALSLSDSLNMKNLLRFYTPSGFKPVDPSQFNYLDQVNELIQTRENLKGKSTSLYSEKGKSTTSLYVTDAPELTDPETDIDSLPKSSSTDGETTTNSASSSNSISSQK